MSPSFDPGPSPAWEQRFQAAPLDEYVNHPSARFRTAFGPVYYRGRLDGSARVLVVGQDPSTDEILAQRILVGEAGQRIQRLMHKLGLTHSYVMLNTFLFGVYGQFDSELRAISREPAILAYRNQLFDQVQATNQLAAVIAIGSAARDAVDRWPGHQGLPIVALLHPTARAGVTASWNARLPGLIAQVAPDPGQVANPTPYGAGFTPADLAPIPATDLPFGLPHWHGSGGTRSTRQRTKDRIVWTAP